MFWRFGFSSTSSLDALLDKTNVSLEEILDEDELLQECKSQNSKLVNYLQQPRVLKRLFEHVVGTAEVGGPGGRDWEEKVRFKYPYICSEVLSCDIWSIVDTSISNSKELLVPFWDAVLTSYPTGNQSSLPHHMHPLFSTSPKTEPSSPKLNVTNLPTIPGEDQEEPDTPPVGVLGLEMKREEDKRMTSARDNGPGKSVLAGYWAKVNGVFLDKKPKEMLEFIRSQPHIVDRFVAHLETPAVVDLLYRIIQCEESVPNANVVDWLSNQNLIPRVVDLLSPHHSTDLHNTVSELLKAVIALSAPSPASLTQNQGGGEGFGFGGADGFGAMTNSSVCGVNNRLVRELASEEIVQRMVGFMLDASLPSPLSRRLSLAADEQVPIEESPLYINKPSAVGARSSKLSSLTELKMNIGAEGKNEFALEDEELNAESMPARIPLNPRDTPASEQSSTDSPGLRGSTATIRPQTLSPPIRAPQVQVTMESCTSSLVTCIGVLIELIRKNNSDYFEQHLFHTLRTHLLQRQQEIAETRVKDRQQKEGQEDDDDDEMEGMEEAMAELSDKLGIVHLGPMLQILCERLPDFQQLIIRPRTEEDTIETSLGRVAALTFGRYRITELYAELLHCSNMALLNRAKGEGPQYNPDGVLQGGIEGLQTLARTLQGGDASSDDEGAANETMGAEVTLNESLASGGPALDEQRGESHIKSPRSHSKEPTKHTRDQSTTGGGGPSNGSEDTDDEALLSEVSLGDLGVATAQVGEEKDPFADEEDQEQGKTKEVKEVKEVKEETDAQGQEEIKSALSDLSLIDPTSQAPSDLPLPTDDEKEYVVGDLLKKKFLESNVIATILTLFFEYPWNNFLHNVVYDILQQFFNGRMDVGLNRQMTLAVFEKGKLMEKIIEGHYRNEESLKSARRIRMGYMGHMNLIADETVKLLERYPEEIEMQVKDHISPEWQAYVNETLKENREKEAAPLAGGRPLVSHGMGFGNHQDGEVGPGDNFQGEGGDNDAFASYLTSQMGVGNTSDDDDSDEDASWLSQDIKQKGAADAAARRGDGDGFDDTFEPLTSASAIKGGGEDDDEEDDDEWGPFADSSDVRTTGSQVSSSAQAYLTPADWASDFQRTTTEAERNQKSAQNLAAVIDDEEEGEEGEESDGDDGDGSRKSSDSGEGSNSTPFVDLLDSASLRQTDAVAAAHARRPSLGQHEMINVPPILSNRPRSSSIGSSSPIAAHATDVDEPLGPGVSPDARSNEETGMIERIVDGNYVQVPLDDVALMSSQQGQKTNDEISFATDQTITRDKTFDDDDDDDDDSHPSE